MNQVMWVLLRSKYDEQTYIPDEEHVWTITLNAKAIPFPFLFFKKNYRNGKFTIGRNENERIFSFLIMIQHDKENEDYEMESRDRNLQDEQLFGEHATASWHSRNLLSFFSSE